MIKYALTVTCDVCQETIKAEVITGEKGGGITGKPEDVSPGVDEKGDPLPKEPVLETGKTRFWTVTQNTGELVMCDVCAARALTDTPKTVWKLIRSEA